MDYAAELRQFGYASADKCAYIRQFDVDGTQLQLKAVLQGHEEDVTAIVWSPVHMQWVTGSEDRTVRVWSAGGIPCLKILSNEGPVSTICIDKLNGCIITGSPDRIIRVFDPVREDKELVQVHSGHTDAIRCVAHIAARGQYVSASWDQTIRTWNAYIKEGRLGSAIKCVCNRLTTTWDRSKKLPDHGSCK